VPQVHDIHTHQAGGAGPRLSELTEFASGWIIIHYPLQPCSGNRESLSTARTTTANFPTFRVSPFLAGEAISGRPGPNSALLLYTSVNSSSGRLALHFASL
jgi:hypothetical protein